jgi:hypothetical protein
MARHPQGATRHAPRRDHRDAQGMALAAGRHHVDRRRPRGSPVIPRPDVPRPLAAGRTLDPEDALGRLLAGPDHGG